MEERRRGKAIEGRRKESLLKDFEERSERISESEEVERLYQDYSAEYREKMMKVLDKGFLIWAIATMQNLEKKLFCVGKIMLQKIAWETLVKKKNIA